MKLIKLFYYRPCTIGPWMRLAQTNARGAVVGNVSSQSFVAPRSPAG